MITYLATYPRSGSALLRGLVGMNFGHITTSDAPIDLTPLVKKFDLRQDGPWDDGYGRYLYWGDGMAHYQPKDGGQRRRVLIPPGMKWLTPSVRQRLAAEPTRFVVKTHNLPFLCGWDHNEYFPGESAIQMVRHPGAACVSLWKLQRDHFKRDVSLAACIKGHSTGGSWSEYHKSWTLTPVPLLTLMYENVFGEQAYAIEAIGQFLGEPLPPALKANPLDRAHAANPVRNPGAGIDGWRADVTEADLDLLQERHGEVADCFGYRIRADAEQSEAAE